MIEAVAVVVPIHNEAERLGACLESIRRAALHVPGVVVSLVLDACDDGSESIVEAMPWPFSRNVLVTKCRNNNVGRTRARGVREALASPQLTEIPRERIWLAMTDADSKVPETWLTSQLHLANDRAQPVDGIAGSIVVPDAEWQESEWPSAISMARDFEQFYADLIDKKTGQHRHVHGANLGVRASAYEAVGGFEPKESAEDVTLWDALTRSGYELRAERVPAVITSARKVARAPRGFSEFLRAFSSVRAA